MNRTESKHLNTQNAFIKIMLRTNTLELKPNKQQQRILKVMLVRSSAVWNIGNYKRRQAFFDKNTKSLSYSSQCKDLKHHELYKELGSAYSQQILKKLDKSWQSFWNSLKSEKIDRRVSIPGYFKNYKTNQTLPKLLICRNDCYRVDDKFVYISCSKDLKEQYGIKGLLKIRYNGTLKWKGTQKGMEIKYLSYLKKFYAYQTEEVEPEIVETEDVNICSIDLGIKRYMSAYIKNSVDINLTYESEHIFEEYVKLTEKIAYYQGIAKRENGKYSTERIRRLYSKRRRKLINYMNNIISHLFRKLIQYRVSKVVIGDLKGIRESKIPEHFKNKKKINAMIQNFWSFDIFKKKLQNKCDEFGIELILINERGTSSTCPACGARVKPNDRKFKCSKCGYENDRDVVGSINILKKYNQAHHPFGDDDSWIENYPILSTILIES